MRISFVCLALAACGGSSGATLAAPQSCNPLGGSSCVAPWPSAIYEVADATTATGQRLAIPDDALPQNIDKITIDPTVFNGQDGFSAAAPMIAAFDTGIDGSTLFGFRDIAKSTTDASPTVLIDLSTGELVPHFAELDAAGDAMPASQALFIRSAAMLKRNTRYAVAIKTTLKAKDGGELPIPEGYAAIVDGTTTNHRLLEAVRPHYTDIFAALAQHGLQPTDVVTAWDFTTGSGEAIRADLVDARDTALAQMGTMGSALAFSVDTDAPGGDHDGPGGTQLIARHITGTFDAPLFLSMGGSPNAASVRLVRGGDGKPAFQGMYRVPFDAIIPQCAIDSATPVPMVIYGHGLLGSSGQVGSNGPRFVAEQVCAVVVGTAMRGMSDVDVPNVALALNDANSGPLIFDVLVQGMVNHVAMVQIARGPMAQQLFTKTLGGATVVDPSQFFYYGISQGGIMGTTVCALDPVIEKCVVQVGGINYSLLLDRSADWPVYGTILSGAYPNPLDDALIINLMQNQWDRTEPTAVADVITHDGLPGTPKKHVFMQFGIADTQVSNLASELQARTMGVPVVMPSPYVPFGLETTSAPVENGVVIYDFGLGNTIPATNIPVPENPDLEVHSSLRNKQVTVDMIKHFYETGEIVQLCTAPTGCDCTQGGCGATL
jgi:hypothetical protein